MGRRELIAVGLTLSAACSGSAPSPRISTPTKTQPTPEAPAVCTPSVEDTKAIEQARNEDDGLLALERARKLDRDCPSRESAWQLAETYAYLWVADEAHAAYERSAKGGTEADVARAKAGIAKVADLPSRSAATQLDTKLRAAVRSLREKADVAYGRPDYAEAARIYEAAYKIDPNPKTLALVGRAFEQQKQPALAARWYARAIINAEIAEKGSVAPTLATGYSDSVGALAFSPDGRMLAAGSSDHNVRVWDLERGNDEAMRVGAFVDEVTSVKFNADGSLLAAGSRDGHARVFDLATGRELLNVDWPSPINAVAFVPGERFLATAGVGGTIRLWNLKTGTRERLLGGRSSEILAMAFAPQGRACACRKNDKSCDPSKEPSLLAAGTSLGTLELWQIASDGTSSFLQSVDVDKWSVRALAFNSTGTKLLTGGGEGATKLFDACTWKKPETLSKHKYWTNAVAFSNDDRLVFSGSADVASKAEDAPTVRMLEFIRAESKVLAFTDTGFTETINALAPHPKFRGRVAAGSGDGVVRTVDETKNSHVVADNVFVPFDMGITPDGETILQCGNDRSVTRWRPASGERITLGTFEGRVTQCRVSGDGKLVVGISDKVVKVFDVATGKEVANFTLACYVWTAALHPTERRIVVGCGDGAIATYDLGSKQPIATVDAKSKTRHEKAINQIVYTTDGSTIVSISADKTVRFWDAKTLAPTRAPLTGFGSDLSAIAISRDGKIIAIGGPDPDIRVFDLTQSDPAPKRMFGHHRTQRRDNPPLAVRELEISPDGKFLVSMGWDRTMRIWDLSAAKPEGVELTRFSSAGRTIKFRDDGKRAYALARDGQLHIYDVNGAKFTLLATLFGAGAEWAAFTPGGDVDASRNGERFINWTVGTISFRSYVGWRRHVKPGLLGKVLAPH